VDILFYILIGCAVVVLLIALSIANYSGNNLIEKFEKLNDDVASSYTFASNFAASVSMAFLGATVKVGKREGYLTDAYIPSKKTVFLSEKVFGSSSVAALAITAHELGHALQDYENSNTLKKHYNLSLAARILGRFMFPLFVLAVVLFFVYPENAIPSLVALAGGVGIFVLALVVKLATVSIEKDASKKALGMIKALNVLDEDELKEAKKLLDAALLTYIGDFLRAILSWTLLTQKTKLFG
jgi:Zn-dependent membrane protease YugP